MVVDLVCCVSVSQTEWQTWRTWAVRVKREFSEVASLFGVTGYAGRLGAAFKIRPKEAVDSARTTESVRTSWPEGISVGVFTVHEAKGKEFDAVVYYSSKPHKVAGQLTCPSEAWWAPSIRSEEREVAYVAVTRAKQMLALLVHSESMTALRRNQKNFADVFDPWPPIEKNS
jgi:superfamily I DNA/RNA helicase